MACKPAIGIESAQMMTARWPSAREAGDVALQGRRALVSVALAGGACQWGLLLAAGKIDVSQWAGAALLGTGLLGWGLCVAVIACGAGPLSARRRLVAWAGVMLGAYGPWLVSNVVHEIREDVTIGDRTLASRVVALGIERGALFGAAAQLTAIVSMLSVWRLLVSRNGSRWHRPFRPGPSQWLSAWTAWGYAAGNLAAALIARVALGVTGVLPLGSETALSGESPASQVLVGLVRAAAAGPYEELGLTVLSALLLLGPRPGTRQWPAIAAVAVVTALIRSTGHFYYSHGEMPASVLPIPDQVAGLLQVIVWCGIWSCVVFVIFVRWERPWALMAAHSGVDVAIVSLASTRFLPEAIATVAAMLWVCVVLWIVLCPRSLRALREADRVVRSRLRR